jgi:hypothetical protein
MTRTAGAAGCDTVRVRPAAVTVPDRPAVVEKFGATENRTSPLELPLAPEDTVRKAALLLVVHPQPACVVTVAV